MISRVALAQSHLRSSITFTEPNPPFLSTLQQYFTALNQSDFAQVSQLFATTGILLPPFEEAIVGPNAILRYLQQEAQDLWLEPDWYTLTLPNPTALSCKLTGRAKTLCFAVPVAWAFQLNAQHQLEQVEVHLLLTPQELLHLRR